AASILREVDRAPPAALPARGNPVSPALRRGRQGAPAPAGAIAFRLSVAARSQAAPLAPRGFALKGPPGGASEVDREPPAPRPRRRPPRGRTACLPAREGTRGRNPGGRESTGSPRRP